MTLRDSREMNYDSKLQNMSWFCYQHVNTRPRQTWPRGSLIIKHYRVQVGNHQRGCRSPCIRHALRKELLLIEQINHWLGVLRDAYGKEVASLSNNSILRTCMTDLGWYQRKQKQSFSNSRRQLASISRELRGSHYFHPNIYLMNATWRQWLQSSQY